MQAMRAGGGPWARTGQRAALCAAPPPEKGAGASGRPGGDDEHGGYGKAVVGGCGCERCARRRRAVEDELRQALAGGRLVDAALARRHLLALGEAGVGLKTVAAVSGVSHGALSKIVYGEPAKGRGRSRRVTRETLEGLLTVTTAAVAGGQRVPAGPTWALLDELLAAGYSRAYLAAELGSGASAPTLQVGKRQVRTSTARAVAQLHQRLLQQ